jgi:hypothetical protein
MRDDVESRDVANVIGRLDSGWPRRHPRADVADSDFLRETLQLLAPDAVAVTVEAIDIDANYGHTSGVVRAVAGATRAVVVARLIETCT